MLVKFNKKPGAHAGGAEFEVGEVYDLDEPSAWRWVRRRVAVQVEPETADAGPRKRRTRKTTTRSQE